MSGLEKSIYGKFKHVAHIDCTRMGHYFIFFELSSGSKEKSGRNSLQYMWLIYNSIVLIFLDLLII